MRKIPEKIQAVADELGVVVVDETIHPGDLYLAMKNTGPHLLECRRHNTETRAVFATKRAYAYDTPDCWKISLSSDKLG